MGDHYCCKRCGLRYDDCSCGLALSEDFSEAFTKACDGLKAVLKAPPSMARPLTWGSSPKITPNEPAPRDPPAPRETPMAKMPGRLEAEAQRFIDASLLMAGGAPDSGLFKASTLIPNKIAVVACHVSMDIEAAVQCLRAQYGFLKIEALKEAEDSAIQSELLDRAIDCVLGPERSKGSPPPIKYPYGED
jgi:hypothetical protein